MQNRLSRFLLPFLAVASLLLLAPPARAAQTPEVLGRPTLGVFHANGTDNNSWMGDLTEKDLTKLFNNDLVQGLQMPGVVAGDYLRLEYAATNYITKITVARLDDTPYSLQVSEDGNSWTSIQRLLSTETYDMPTGLGTNETWGVWLNAKFVRLVFSRAGSSEPGLAEIEVRGYEVVEAPESSLVSSYARTTWHNADGSQMDSNGGGGGYSPSSFFNGNFTDYCLLPRCPDNGYTIIDVTMNGGPCYVEKIMIGHAGNRKYSLYYSMDGSTWSPVSGAVNVQYSGIATYAVGAKATKVKYVFNEGTAGNWTLKHLAEIQIWGIDPDTLPCEHPDLASASWTPVPDSATCTERGEVERFCPACEQRFVAMADLATVPPLGHAFVTHLDREGAYKKYGTGRLDCSRCGYTIPFPEPIDLVTSKVDGVKIGGVATPGLIRFTDISVSSENHPEWGGGIESMLDNDWTWVNAHLGVWASYGGMNQYADFAFAAEIDLTDVDISIRNVDQTLQFFSVDDATGTETLIDEYPVVYDDTLVETRNGAEVVCEWQRVTVHFYETPIKHLRIRRRDEATPFSLWSSSPCFVIVECHPWGTVHGACDLRYRKETIMVFR